jgi:hypothetical protein
MRQIASNGLCIIAYCGIFTLYRDFLVLLFMNGCFQAVQCRHE